jgi:ATP-dependent DNA helicase RecG
MLYSNYICSLQPDENMITKEQDAKAYELLPALRTSLSDINTDYFKNNYLPVTIDKETLAENGRTIEEQLASLRFYDTKEQ